MFLKSIRVIFFVLCFVLFGQSANAQTITYTFIDPCTKEVTLFSIPVQSGKTTIIFYGKVGNFDANDVSNGTFANWINQSYSDYRKISPCSQQQGQVTQNQITTQIISNTVQSIVSSIMSSAQSQSVNTETGSNDAGGKGNNDNSNKKKNDGSNNTNGTSTGSSSNQNGGESQSSSGTNKSDGGANNSQGGGTTTNSGGSTNSGNSTQGGGSTTQPPVGSGSGTSGSSGNNGGSSGSGSTGGSGSGSGSSGNNGGSGSGGTTSGNSGNNGGSSGSGSTGTSGSGSTTSGNSGNNGGSGTTSGTDTKTQKGEEVGATTTMNNDAHNDNGSGGGTSGGSSKSGKSGGNARSNPIIVSSDITSAQNLNKSYTPIINVGTSRSSMTGLSSYGVTGMVWLNFEQFALSARYTKIHFNKSKKLKFVHNVNLTGVYTYGNFLGFVGYSGILNGGKYGITGFNISGAATIIATDKSGYYSPSITAFYTRPIKVNKKLIISPEIYLISTPLVYSTKENVTISDRFFSGFIGSGFDYQISKRFKVNVNYKANLSTNPQVPILSFFLIGSKINL
jgi:hypothetical protein